MSSHLTDEQQRRARLLLQEIISEPHEHLSYEEMERYVDGKLDDIDREIVMAKSEICSVCRDDTQALSAFAAERNRVISFRRPMRLSLAAAALIALVMGGGWLIREFRRVPRPVVAPVVVRRQPAPTPAQRELAVKLADGGRTIGLDASGSLVGLDGLQDAQRARIATLLAGGSVAMPAFLAQIAPNGGTLRGPQRQQTPAVQLLDPVGKVVESTKPTMRWTSMAGATYVVTIYDSRYREVISSGTLKTATWNVPRPLRRGQIYSWQLTVSAKGRQWRVPVPPDPEAKFAVLAADLANRLEQLARSFGDSHLVMGTAYAEAGLVDRAKVEFRKLQEANPDSMVAKKLVADVESR